MSKHGNGEEPSLTVVGSKRKAPERRMRAFVKEAVESAIKNAAAGKKPSPSAHPADHKLHEIAVAALDAAKESKYTPGQLAKALCEVELMQNVAFWVAVRDGQIDGAMVGDMLRASENLANRGGLPVMSQSEISGSLIGKKLVDLTGVLPGVPVDGAPPEGAQPTDAQRSAEPERKESA